MPLASDLERWIADPEGRALVQAILDRQPGRVNAVASDVTEEVSTWDHASE